MVPLKRDQHDKLLLCFLRSAWKLKDLCYAQTIPLSEFQLMDSVSLSRRNDITSFVQIASVDRDLPRFETIREAKTAGVVIRTDLEIIHLAADDDPTVCKHESRSCSLS